MTDQEHDLKSARYRAGRREEDYAHSRWERDPSKIAIQLRGRRQDVKCPRCGHEFLPIRQLGFRRLSTQKRPKTARGRQMERWREHMNYGRPQAAMETGVTYFQWLHAEKDGRFPPWVLEKLKAAGVLGRRYDNDDLKKSA